MTLIEFCENRITASKKAEEKLRADPNTTAIYGLHTVTLMETRRQCYRDVLAFVGDKETDGYIHP